MFIIVSNLSSVNTSETFMQTHSPNLADHLSHHQIALEILLDLRIAIHSISSMRLPVLMNMISDIVSHTRRIEGQAVVINLLIQNQCIPLPWFISRSKWVESRSSLKVLSAKFLFQVISATSSRRPKLTKVVFRS